MKLLLLSFIVPCFAFSQKTKTRIPQNSIIKKWTQATVNLQSSSKKYTTLEIEQKLKDSIYLLKETKPAQYYNSLRYSDSLKLSFEQTLSSGTAIYLSDSNKKYLITAKHVLIDYKDSWNSFYQDRQRSIKYQSGEFHPLSDYQSINHNIAICTPYDYYVTTKRSNNQDILFSYTIDRGGSVIFSDDSLDIAIISLQNRMAAGFKRDLDSNHCIPIKVSDIDTTGLLAAGEDFFVIGYPQLSNILREQNPVYFSTGNIVLPIVTFGRIAMNNPSLNYLIGDVTIYPGNSGGPAIINNKLIGIVNSQNLVEVEAFNDNGSQLNLGVNLYSRGLLGVMRKSKYILPLLRKLQSAEHGPYFR